jgi:hypothetical protein
MELNVFATEQANSKVGKYTLTIFFEYQFTFFVFVLILSSSPIFTSLSHHKTIFADDTLQLHAF